MFADILKLVPWAAFDKLVKNHGSDELVRSFTTKRQLLALLYGQLSGACSLRDVEASMKSHQGGFIMRAASLLRARLLRTPTAAAIRRCSRVLSCICWP